jgi:hypothetical protein
VTSQRQNLPNDRRDTRRQVRRESLDPLVGEQLVEPQRPAIGVGDGQPPVRVGVGGAGQVRLPQVTDGVAERP